MTPNRPTPDEARTLLSHGNKRYTENNPDHPRADNSRRNATKSGQHPFATVLTCSDSRVPPELIFDCGIGDIFVVRVAGNITDNTVMAGIQYAVSHLDCPLVVVLGHSSCGAVTTSLFNDADIAGESQEIQELIATIRDNTGIGETPEIEAPAKINEAVYNNTMAVTAKIASDPTIAPHIADGRTKVIPAHYDICDGVVRWL